MENTEAPSPTDRLIDDEVTSSSKNQVMVNYFKMAGVKAVGMMREKESL